MQKHLVYTLFALIIVNIYCTKLLCSVAMVKEPEVIYRCSECDRDRDKQRRRERRREKIKEILGHIATLAQTVCALTSSASPDETQKAVEREGAHLVQVIAHLVAYATQTRVLSLAEDDEGDDDAAEALYKTLSLHGMSERLATFIVTHRDDLVKTIKDITESEEYAQEE